MVNHVPRRLGRSGILAVLLAILLLAGCQTHRTRLTLRGGPSLDPLFSDLAAAYQAQHPDVTVITDFTCPPCVLFKKPGAARDFDLFVSPGQFELDRLHELGQLNFSQTEAIGTTSLAVAVSSHSKTPIHSLADLHRPTVRRIGVGDPAEVSIGYYAQQGLSKAGLWDELKSHFVYSQSGCELLKWLALSRDVDAAIVFGLCAGEQSGSISAFIEFPPDLVSPVPLLLAMPANAPNPREAHRFSEFMKSPEAQRILARHHVRPVSPS